MSLIADNGHTHTHIHTHTHTHTLTHTYFVKVPRTAIHAGIESKESIELSLGNGLPDCLYTYHRRLMLAATEYCQLTISHTYPIVLPEYSVMSALKGWYNLCL